VLALVNKMGRTRLACGKNIRGDGELRLPVATFSGVAPAKLLASVLDIG
jgi:hypothetical protein